MTHVWPWLRWRARALCKLHLASPLFTLLVNWALQVPLTSFFPVSWYFHPSNKWLKDPFLPKSHHPRKASMRPQPVSPVGLRTLLSKSYFLNFVQKLHFKNWCSVGLLLGGSFGHCMKTARQVMQKDCAFVLESGVNWKDSVCQTSSSIAGTQGFVKCPTVGKQTREQCHQSMSSLACTTHKGWKNDVTTYKLMNWMQQWAETCIDPLLINQCAMGLFKKIKIMICKGLGFKEAEGSIQSLIMVAIIFLLLKTLSSESFFCQLCSKITFLKPALPLISLSVVFSLWALSMCHNLLYIIKDVVIWKHS